METLTKRTRSVSYRVDSEVLDEVIREADYKRTSVNTLINQVLQKFVEFDRYQKRLNIIPVPKQLLIDLINGCNDQEIKFLAETAYRVMKDAVIFMRKEQDLEAFLQALEEYAKVTGLPSDHRVNGSEHKFVIEHDMGLKWSEFIKEFLSIIFEKHVNKRADFALTESCVMATIELPEVMH